ncbi:hypothetical protein ERO13_A06G082600v2 [Gossypium hirsutum]|uniref:E3 ubiquitin ligase PQT3-like isoform X1 n=1 Tax=Gossypium hirsutum TaxID=3635 RepID=A0A1U8MZB2_GOSHI|nr:E3 ubiquitin ligase PQT3-like isoform X1 [Gossypium hirsutum]KAG4194966.1 hypothetical protein ERO13_A06G082600v2 [Gossypium hirsutum]KAG4194967.1 hypothetical protein ERO13_A06G082600v2 [Gossypium hirsutum]
MSVHFKFRSSRNYDSIDIGGQPSISVRDLKSSIVQNKKLNLCQDFDLLFSDPISGQEYVHEDFQIPCGSSVIIKRVPAGAHLGSCKVFATPDEKMSKTSHLQNAETVNFDDFGAEICPVTEGNLSCNIEDRFCIDDEDTHFKLKSCTKQPVVECQKIEGSDISEAVPQGQILPGTKSKADIELNAKLSTFLAMQPSDFPSELKCSLCGTFFKEAVLIPCCQHSFCEKCILHVLVEKARCPKCFSTKCKVEDLLPNLSLRQATERFLKSQIVVNNSENALDRYAPDGESGIQVKDVSCAVSVIQRGAKRGSNQVHAESIGGTSSHVNGNRFLKDKISKMPAHKLPKDLEGFDDFQGENQPTNEEVTAESYVKKKRTLWVDTADAEMIYVEMARLKKGDRVCYMCGSPGHLRRDCPAVSSPHPMLQRGNAVFPGALPGYVSPYWNGPYYPPIRPFANPYDPSGMMSFNTTVIPAAPFHVPTYMPSMFGASRASGGFTRIGGLDTAMKKNIDHQLCPSGLDGQYYDKKHQNTSENVMRKLLYDENDGKRWRYDEAERAYEKKIYPERGRTASYSEDSFNKNSLMKNWNSHIVDDEDVYSNDGRDYRSSQVAGQNLMPYHHSGRSRSKDDDIPSISSCQSWERHNEHGHRSSRKRNDRREHCYSDSTWTYYPTNRERDSKRKTVKHDAQKHYNHSESSSEPPYHSTDQKKKRERDSSRSSRHSKHKAKPACDELIHDRWQMSSCRSDEENQEKCHYNKRKRCTKTSNKSDV